MSNTYTPTILQIGHLLSSPDGIHLMQQAVSLALAGCRRDIELQCPEINQNGQRWYDTTALFIGTDPNDVEFSEMLLQAVMFLDRFEQIKHHPEHTHWVNFQLNGV